MIFDIYFIESNVHIKANIKYCNQTYSMEILVNLSVNQVNPVNQQTNLHLNPQNPGNWICMQL